MASKELPSDLIYDIISRTPSLKTLDICKTVCKEWKKFIYEANFMPLYCQRTNNVYGYFVQDMKHNEHFSEFVSFDQDGTTSSPPNIRSCFPRNTRILASCMSQGILCCQRLQGSRYRYYVCKPTTGQWRALPNPKIRYRTTAVAMRVVRTSPALRYKIVRLSEPRVGPKIGYHTHRCEVFDSQEWKWRRLQDLNLPYPEFIIMSTPSVFVGNSVYWRTNKDNVVEFNEDNESFNRFSLPEYVHNGCKSMQLIEYEGGLGLICSREDDHCFELWIRKEMAWRRKMEVDIKNVDKYASPVGFYNAGIAFLKAFNEVLFYKIQDRSVRRWKLDELWSAREVFQFRSDFEIVDLGSRKS
ncbi:hypothetical protein DH2020_049383 [Rehmannia glutinosa]|uniref:F-box associated beta-propeller type 3 domain-containing protein n=1 Tax=Rehmannia glutinosa TaxID=99300 RepID=A0ABR0U3R4_REHGL